MIHCRGFLYYDLAVLGPASGQDLVFGGWRKQNERDPKNVLEDPRGASQQRNTGRARSHLPARGDPFSRPSGQLWPAASSLGQSRGQLWPAASSAVLRGGGASGEGRCPLRTGCFLNAPGCSAALGASSSSQIGCLGLNKSSSERSGVGVAGARAGILHEGVPEEFRGLVGRNDTRARSNIRKVEPPCGEMPPVAFPKRWKAIAPGADVVESGEGPIPRKAHTGPRTFRRHAV